MKTLIVALLATLATGAVFAAPTQSHKPYNPNAAYNASFVKQFNDQAVATNKALRSVTNLDCTATKEDVASHLKVLALEVIKFSILAKNIPETQDDLVQLKELETFYGALFLSKQFVDQRDSGCIASRKDNPNTLN
jgi:hypothetical protein